MPTELKSLNSNSPTVPTEKHASALAGSGSFHALQWLAWKVARVLSRLFFRLKIVSAGQIPQTGGALLVVNGLSRLDLFFLVAISERPMRFVTTAGGSLIGRLILLLFPHRGPSSKECQADIAAGELLCFRGEEELSRIGQMLPFGKRLEKVMENVRVPVIPIALDGASFGGVWRGARRHQSGSARGRLRPKVAIVIGSPLPENATALDAFAAIQHLLADAWQERKSEMRPLHRELVRTARKHPFRFSMGDARTPRLNFLNALARTIYLGNRLSKPWSDHEFVGILLPPSIGGALVNFAALLAGRIPVNLNYSASSETVASCLQQCGIRTVISSKAFLEKIPLRLPCQMILLEDVAANPRLGERLKALLMACCWPVRALERSLGRSHRASMDDPATVIFSSGSTGQPKGVVLSHFNLGSNIAQLDRVFGLTRRDCFLGTLPFFHSFGFMGTLWLTGTLGVGVVYHPTPLDPAAVSRLVRDYSLTFLLSTPTFLQLYLRGCAADDFGSLRVVMAGAEKLHERLAAAFEEKFGIRPLEGYGCTECAPAVAVNTHDYRAAGIRQVGAKRGSIGRPLPGVSVRILDIDTLEPLPVGKSGLLVVSGPNVMQGYLNDPQKTANVLCAGWYHTGDIAAVDGDGFVHITDRLSRFSKIGGEMVPHIRVEERLHEIIKATELTFVVAGVPDPRRGERLIVLHRLSCELLTVCLNQLAQDGMPNLWKPKREDFVLVEAFPLLGTGKLDLRRIKELAVEFAPAPKNME